MAATYPFYAEKRVDKCMPLAYSFSMQTVVETPMFLRAAEDLYSEADREEIVRTIAATPEAGDLMPGTGGYRKLRFARSGMGKRGGARVVYLYGGEDLPIFLITVYAKSEKGNLSKRECPGQDGEEFLCRNQGEAMSKLFEEMAQGTAEARAYMEGERKGYKVTLPETVDVRGLRKRLRLSQGRFADCFGLSVDAVRHWESGRRQPEAAARALLIVIAADPEFVMRSLAKSA